MTTPAAPAPDGTTPSGDTSTAPDGFKPITSQEDLNRVLSDRLERERAKYADYKDVKAKASRLDELEQASKTEAEKVAERLSKADAEVASVPSKVADALRTHLVELHSIDKDDAELFLTANDPELLLKQVSRLVGRQAEGQSAGRKAGNHVPREGSTPPAAENEARTAVRGIFGGST